jgi:hypothetical protein
MRDQTIGVFPGDNEWCNYIYVFFPYTVKVSNYAENDDTLEKCLPMFVGRFRITDGDWMFKRL